jgi:peroxiredoxin
MRHLIAVLSVILFTVSPLRAAEWIQVGPDVGAYIPDDFAAFNAAGEPVGLSDITGERGVVLGFVRSASWCPFCQTQMKDLQTIAADLEQRGYALAVLSYDAPTVLDQFAKRQGITYTLLSDEQSYVIDAFDIRDPQYGEDSMAYGVPQPAIFIIDPSGVIQGKLAMEGYRDRPPLEDILSAVDTIIGDAS